MTDEERLARLEAAVVQLQQTAIHLNAIVLGWAERIEALEAKEPIVDGGGVEGVSVTDAIANLRQGRRAHWTDRDGTRRLSDE